MTDEVADALQVDVIVPESSIKPSIKMRNAVASMIGLGSPLQSRFHFNSSPTLSSKATGLGNFCKPDLSPEERSLFLEILNTPEALNRVCRVVMVLDLVLDSERYFSKGIFGPQLEMTVDAILPFLPGEIQDYWTSLRRVDRDGFDNCIDRMFEPFHASLRKTEIRDITTGESVPFRGQRPHN